MTEKESWVRVTVELPVKCKMLPYPLRHFTFDQRGQ